MQEEVNKAIQKHLLDHVNLEEITKLAREKTKEKNKNIIKNKTNKQKD